MNLFEIVKYGVSCREAAELYGVEVNRYGMALCPFHNDRHPSILFLSRINQNRCIFPAFPFIKILLNQF